MRFSPFPRPVPGDARRTALRVSAVSILANLLLTVFKLAAALLGHSTAMLSDAVHSASDVFSTVIVMIGVTLAAKAPDQDHPYGHERFECVAALLLAVVLAAAGLGIGRAALAALLPGNGRQAPVPGRVAMVAAAVSIAVKEAMYWYTRHYARRLDSAALMADAWHHRSDALSSVGALIGIGGARLGAAFLEPAASLVICAFILKAAYDIFRDAAARLVDHACDAGTEAALRRCAAAQAGVKSVDMLQTREFGSRIYVDIEIGADAMMPLFEAHAVAERVHDAIERDFPKVKHIMVHVNPSPPVSCED